MPLAPRSAIPIPEKNAEADCGAGAEIRSKIVDRGFPRHERVLFSTVLPFTSKSPTGLDGKASKYMPAQLSWIVFPAKELMPVCELPMDLFPAMVVLTLFSSASIPIQ